MCIHVHKDEMILFLICPTHARAFVSLWVENLQSNTEAAAYAKEDVYSEKRSPRCQRGVSSNTELKNTAPCSERLATFSSAPLPGGRLDRPDRWLVINFPANV